MTDRKAKNAEIFSDTERRYKTEPVLIEAVKQSKAAQQFIPAGGSVAVPEAGRTERAKVIVSGKRSLEAAESYAKLSKAMFPPQRNPWHRLMFTARPHGLSECMPEMSS